MKIQNKILGGFRSATFLTLSFGAAEVYGSPCDPIMTEPAPHAQHSNSDTGKVQAILGMAWEFPNLVVLNLNVCNFYAEALFCAQLHSFAPLLRSFAGLRLRRSFALIFCFCIRSRLEPLRLGTAEWLGISGCKPGRSPETPRKPSQSKFRNSWRRCSWQSLNP